MILTYATKCELYSQWTTLNYFQPKACSTAEALFWAVFTGSVLTLFTDSTDYLLCTGMLSAHVF